MRLFWEIAIEPILAAARPARILEIGVAEGHTTGPLVQFAESRGAIVEAIDPQPKIDTAQWERDHRDAVRFHRGLSIDVLPGLEPVGAALIDGDHNWHTVHSELLALERLADEHETMPPVVLLHDMGWPYGRRDLYYTPDTIPADARQEYALRGLLPDSDELADDGFNAHLHHAVRAGGPRNGVRQAVDDFVEESEREWRLTVVPGAHGLGVLAPAALLEENARLRDTIDALAEPEFLNALIDVLERNRIDAELRRQRASRRLAAAAGERDALRIRLDALGAPAGEQEPLAGERRLRVEAERELLAVARAKAEAEGMLQARARELSLLETALDDARRAAAAVADEVTTARAEREDAFAAASREARERADAERLAEQHERGADDARRDADEARRALEAAHAERAELEARIAERERRLEEVTAARARLAADVDDTRETLETQLEEARADAGRARVAARELRERLEGSELEATGLHEELRLLRQSLAEARADAEIAIAQRVGLESRLAAASAERDAAAARAAAQGAQRAGTPLPSEPELRAKAQFLREYRDAPAAPGAPFVVDSSALPAVRDLRRVLVDEHPPGQDVPSVDVIVCVHDALDDVRRCLWSVLHKTERPLRLVVVNDGSDEATTAFLRSVAGAEPAIKLVENLKSPHGYTIAANLGLRAATGDYLVLLNSDTIVTRGWLDRIVECGESDPAIGILGPLSNAASHQSVPELRHEGKWATNPLPRFVTPDGVATLVRRVAPAQRPRVPFINGFCLVIKRAVIDAVGYLDEEHFASGYCEENDLCVRAAEAGFELAIADDGYVYHAKSKSYSPEGRRQLARRNYEIFLDKHGRERIQEMVREMESSTALTPLRATLSDALSSGHSLCAALDAGRDALKVVFILPGLGVGGSGGSHSIYQEVRGLRTLGVDAEIALKATAMERARAAYEDVDDLFRPYRDVDDLLAITEGADVVSATHFKSVRTLAELVERRPDFLPAYYIQDYEPFFISKDSADIDEAVASYTLIRDCLLFAKTHWLCNIVAERHGVRVAKVEPSIDEQLYRESGARDPSDTVRIAAMIRPRTPRRQPTATVAALKAVSESLGSQVKITTFGCPQADLERFTDHAPILSGHRGILSRAQVAELLGVTDVFLDLSMYQAFGRTALEAMACGATAVVPRLGGVWEFVEHRENAIAIDAFDHEQAVTAIAELVADRALLARLRANARSTAARYSILRASLSEYMLFAAEARRRASNTLQTSA